MKKPAIFRLFAGLCAAAAIAVSSAVPVFADLASGDIASADEVTSFDDGILTYSVIDDSRFVEITACVTTASHVNVRAEIDGFTVTGIADGAFAGCTQLQSLTLPTSGELTSIGQYAFAECTSLKSIKLPSSVTEIPIGAFYYCTSLEQVTIGDSVTYIGDEAFRECSSLTSIELPETLTSMGAYTFYMCSSLSEINVPESLTSMGGYNFMGCISLESFNVPATLEDMGDAPFLGCSSMKELTVDENHPTYKIVDNVLYSRDGTILYYYMPSLTADSFTVPEGIVDIYDGAFFQCTALEAVILPSTLTTIGSSAFEYCSSLQSITIPKSVTQIMNASFADCDSLSTVVFEGADDENDGEGESLVIGDQAFFVCESLMEVTLPKRVTAIGENAFGVTEIEDSSGNPIPTAVEGFMLRGFDSAEEYIKSCKDNGLSVGFSPRSFPWKKVVFWVIAAGVLIVIVYFAVRLVKNNMMTPEEKEALRQAKAERQSAEDAEEDDGYKSILADDDEQECTQPETEEEKAAREAEELKRFRGAANTMTHFKGHDD